ncbi:MAG: hypothetical protein GY907_01330 [Bacteroidetes bacterium]|nr:hypothetical protein [Bacteroidota bacterium]
MLRIFKIVLFILTVLGLVSLTVLVKYENTDIWIKDITVNIYRPTEIGFLSSEIVLNQLGNIDSIQNLTLRETEIESIEELLMINPHIENVDSYVTLDGKLLINICEKVPIIRIYDANGKSIYVDKNGNFIPLSNRYTPRVIIASGYIGDMNINLSNNIHDSTYIDTPLNNVFQINNLIAKNDLLKSQIGQVYVNSIGEYDLIPILGNHIIKLGKTVNVEEKMENLTSYYKKNLVTEDWDKYRTINLKYKDQIVCTKK